MVLKNSHSAPSEAGSHDDRFCEVEMGTSFKRLICPRCNLEAIYKYSVRQVRRRPEILVEEGEEVRSDHIEMWKSIPRFAEIPSMLRCKRCREVLTMEVVCLY